MGAVHRLSGRPPEEVRAALNRLRVKEVIVPREPPVFSGELEFAFRHVLIRDVAYESLPKSLRAAKHIEAAKWAEERAGDRSDEIAEALADHYGQALAYIDELGESDRREPVREAAYRWSRLAGDRAMRLWQQREAVRWYRSALDLSHQVDVEASELARLWEAYGEACMGVEPFDEVERAFENALHLYEELEMWPDAGRLESRLARATWEGGKESEVPGWIERALARLEPLGPSHELAGALMFAGTYHWRMERLSEAEPFLRRSIEMAREVGAQTLEGESLQSLGVVLSHGERWQEGLPMVEQSFEIAKEAGDLPFLLRSHNNLPRTLLDCRPDYPRARAILLEGLELARRTGRRDYETWILNNLSLSSLDLGNLDEAERFSVQCFESAARISYTIMMVAALHDQATVQLLRGNLQEARRLNEENVRLQGEIPVEFQAEPYEAVLKGRLAEALGTPEEAMARYVKTLDRLAGEMTTGYVEVAVFEAVRLLSREGRRAEAEPYADRLREVANGRPHAEAFSWWADGILADAARDAAVLFEKAAARFESLGRRIDLARCLLDLAEAQRQIGMDPRPTLTQAHGVIVETGANLYLPRVDAALAAAAT
jgi:tetratricopeptide (TPR) repeat protein